MTCPEMTPQGWVVMLSKSTCFIASLGCVALGVWPVGQSAYGREFNGMRVFTAGKSRSNQIRVPYSCAFRWPFTAAGNGTYTSTFTCNMGDAVGIDVAVDCPSFKISFRGGEMNRDVPNAPQQWSQWKDLFALGKDNPIYRAATATCQ